MEREPTPSTQQVLKHTGTQGSEGHTGGCPIASVCHLTAPSHGEGHLSAKCSRQTL